MYTQCTHCGTLFRIAQAQLRAVDGTVRCGLCRGVFDARRTLRTELLKNETETPAAAEVAPTQPAGDPFSTEELHLFETAKSAQPASRQRPRPMLAGLSAAALLVALIVQFAFFERDALSAHPMLRPLIERMCAVVGCSVALPRNPAAIRFLDRDVRAHPEQSGALLVNITIRSDTSYRQAYPSLQIELTSIGDRAVARRRLGPQEYLDNSVDRASGMPPHTPVQITIELAAPQEPVSGFRLDLS